LGLLPIVKNKSKTVNWGRGLVDSNSRTEIIHKGDGEKII